MRRGRRYRHYRRYRAGKRDARTPLIAAVAGVVSIGLVVAAVSASHLFSARTAAATAPAVNMNCTLIVPPNPLTAQGLATPYQLTATNPGAGQCNETNANQTAFVQGAVINPATGQISVYNPLVIDKGTQPAQQPAVPALPAGGIVALWFGFNGNTLTLQGADQAGVTPTGTPSVTPTTAPTAAPSGTATASPTLAPTTSPTVAPTASPTLASTATPSASPTATASASPTPVPSPTWSEGGGGYWYYYFWHHHHRYLRWRHHRHGHGWRYGTTPAARVSGTVPIGVPPTATASATATGTGPVAGVPTTPPANANVAAASATPDAILQQANCIAGMSIQGQFSSFTQMGACNAVAFFQAANAAIQAGKLTVPAPGTAVDGQPCPTTRDFSLIDQDQSDNVTTEYLANGNGQTAQDTAANQQALAGSTTLFNGSDNGLLDFFVDPALGCTSWKAPDLANGGAPAPALPLDELQAAAFSGRQGGPAALVPQNDPMTLDNNGNFSPDKTNTYRSIVDQPALPAGETPSQYCGDMENIQGTRLQQDVNLLIGKAGPLPALASNLFTFLAMRLQQSFMNLNCQNFGMQNDVSTTVNAAGAVVAACFLHPVNPVTAGAGNPTAGMTVCPASTATASATSSASSPASPSASASATASPSGTALPTASAVPSGTASASAVPSGTASASAVASASGLPSASAAPTASATGDGDGGAAPGGNAGSADRHHHHWWW